MKADATVDGVVCNNDETAKAPRRERLLPDVTADVAGDIVTLSGPCEKCGCRRFQHRPTG